MTLSPPYTDHDQFLRRQSTSSHQDAELYYSNNLHLNNPQATNNNTLELGGMTITSSGEISASNFSQTRPLHCNVGDHGQENDNNFLPSTRVAPRNDLSHPSGLQSSFPAYSPQSHHHQHQPLTVSTCGEANKFSAPQKTNTHHQRTHSYPNTGSGANTTESRVDQLNITTELLSNNVHNANFSSHPPKPTLKKNGKPLAKCPFCGMTFKKLEHCQRHERTHTLARPYTCTVCLKTFARQFNTLNRHIRLHSRSDGKMSTKKSSPTQPAQESARALSSSPSKKVQRNRMTSPICSNFDLFMTGSGVSPASFASPPHAHKPISRDRGLSLSALEHSTLQDHLRRDPLMLSGNPRQSICLPLQRHQEQLAQPHHQPAHPFQYQQAPSSSSQLGLEMLSSPSDSLAGYSYVEPTETRRGSWCPGGTQNWAKIPPLAPDDPGVSMPSTRRYSHQPQNLSLGAASWSKTLTNTFGLVEGGTGPVPLSAPATCTNWGAPLIGSGASETINSPVVGPLVGPKWETLPQLYETEPLILTGWSSLGCLEEDDHIKFNPESSINSTGTSQILVSSTSQPGSFNQPNLIDQSCSTGLPSTKATQEPPLESNSSVHWSSPPGGSLSYHHIGLDSVPGNTVTGFTSSDPMVKCFENLWQGSPKQSYSQRFCPPFWNPPVCNNNHEKEQKATVLDPTSLLTRNPWEDNQMVELNF
ncbi:hypothetical protein VP01_2585g2 [Puccinia sorghi]|uniref:C2H2-type domain-containing protein n=1 Tax=Puccinia sorghi TaxID=27349 RepID=A0A0L6V5F1_9BASI|nr:hypothetical protein VP01_2585g2 [Puccinia sorghi]